MDSAEFQLRGVEDARLAVHATSALPAWLWSTDGSRVLWANPVGTMALGAASGTVLTQRTFGHADPQRRQIAQLAARLRPDAEPRLERLRGFGAQLGGLVTCACTRLSLGDDISAILIAAAAQVGRSMSLTERLQRLVEDVDTPIAAFAQDGMFVSASAAARPLLGFRNLSEAGLDTARNLALREGRVETPIGIGHVVLQRVGSGADTALIALIAPGSKLHSLPPLSTVTSREAVTEPAPGHSSIISAEIVGHPALEQLPSPTPISDVATVPADEPTPDELLFDAFDEASSIPADLTRETPPHETDLSRVEPAPTTNARSEAPDIVATEITPMPSQADPDESPAPAKPDTCPPPRSIEPKSPQPPLRFVWQMDAESRFAFGSDEFTRLIGANTTAAFGRPWHEIVAAFDLDPQGLVANAIATRETWSGITLQWPVDEPGRRLPVELSGLPVFDRSRTFIGYRGFGVCRDLDAISELAAQQSGSFENTAAPHPLTADVPRQIETPPHSIDATSIAEADAATDELPSLAIEPDHLLENSQNVVPFRSTSDAKSPALTPVENSAFNELARQLSARLEHDNTISSAPPVDEIVADDPPTAPDLQPEYQQPHSQSAQTDTPQRGENAHDKRLLDLVPTGILVYRLEQLLYANEAFLRRIGYDNLAALNNAGGLDALYIEPSTVISSVCETGTAVTVATTGQSATAVGARLHTIEWNGATALALICSDASAPAQAATHATVSVATPSAVGHANAEELGAILDTAAEGIVMFDGGGQISACNRSTEALFGYEGDELVRLNLTELFAPESRSDVRDYLESIKGPGVASLLDHGREVLGRVREGGFIPLAMTMGRTSADSPNFFAVFRDMSQSKKNEAALLLARRQTERAVTAKAEVLARVSHEIRAPLNAIIGFSEVMIDERLGSLGNERYIEYIKDIRASGERVGAIVDEMLDLSQIETGKLDLAFARHNLNDMLEQCVAVLQPRANRERIIIRTSLAHTLPAVVADARTLRQIALNLIGNSIHLANTGGQVIVSTALSDLGEIVLRVRDTGHGLNDNELAAAVEPFGMPTPDQTPNLAGVSLALTKALVEANRARFNIKSASNSGTIIEVTFAPAEARV